VSNTNFNLDRFCIVSEPGADRSLADYFDPGIVFVGYDDLVTSCVNLIRGSPVSRSAMAQRGYELFSARELVAILPQLLGLSQRMQE
jgi:hypothetical protein